MNITVLDGYTLNPGDLSWDGFLSFGNVTVFDRTPQEDIVERAKHSRIILTNKTPLRQEVLELLPELRYIGVLATGYDVVDIEAAAARNIAVTNIPSYGSDSVAQYVFALLLELCHHVGLHSDSVRKGDWSESLDFSYTRAPLTELTGKTIGIIGLGRIGLRTAEIASAFGMRVKAYTPRMNQEPPLPQMEWSPLNELLEASDVVSLHCPLKPDTQGMINRDVLSRMKPSAYLINTSRGKLIVEEDLADALHQGQVAGAALDVLSVEPPVNGSPLVSAPNCIITPHIAWATKEARSRLLATAVDNVRSFLNGSPINVVNRR